MSLCACGADLTEHDDISHPFVASGTKYRCEKPVGDTGYFCPRPRYHDEEGVECGPLTGELLWGDSDGDS